MDFGQYVEEFENALQISNAWNLDVDTSDSRLLEPADLQRTAELADATLAMAGPEVYSKSCGSFHTTQRHVIRKQDSGLNPVITIGWIEFDGRPFFKTTRRKLRREMKKNAKRQSYDPLDYHAWLTVRDGDAIQIIDCTIAFYMCRHGLVPENQTMIWQFRPDSPSEAHEWIEYHPLLAGQKTLEAVGTLQEGFDPFSGNPA